MIKLPIPTPAMDLADICRAVAAYRATDPAYNDERGVLLETRWVDALQAFFDAGGTREEADAIEDRAFSPFETPNPLAALSFDECEAAGVDGTGRFIG